MKRAVQSKWTSEWCKRTDKRTIKWSNAFAPILGCSVPLWSRRKKGRSARLHVIGARIGPGWMTLTSMAFARVKTTLTMAGWRGMGLGWLPGKGLHYSLEQPLIEICLLGHPRVSQIALYVSDHYAVFLHIRAREFKDECRFPNLQFPSGTVWYLRK